MVNSRPMWFLEEHRALSPNQFGYRQNHSSLDSITLLDLDIGQAFSNRKFVAIVFFDLIKVHDTAWRHHILNELHGSPWQSPTIPGKLPKT